VLKNSITPTRKTVSAAASVFRNMVSTILQAVSRLLLSHNQMHDNQLPEDQREIAERICSLVQCSGGPHYDCVIQMALNHLQNDLHSERGADAREDIRREMAFRKWCEALTGDEANYSWEAKQ